MDLHRLVNDVRRRVEHEVTFEGHEKRTNFLSSLLPSTPEMIHHALVQGGFLPTSASEQTPTYAQVTAFHLNPEQPHEQPVSQRALSGTTQPSIDESTLSSSQLSRSQPRRRASDASNPVSEGSLPLSTSSNPYPHISSDSKFLQLIEETQSVIASPDFARVLEVCLDRSMEVLFQGLLRNVFVEPSAQDSFNDDVRVRLAGLLPGLARWSQLALDSLPNELVDVSASVSLGCLERDADAVDCRLCLRCMRYLVCQQFCLASLRKSFCNLTYRFFNLHTHKCHPHMMESLLCLHASTHRESFIKLHRPPPVPVVPAESMACSTLS